MSGTLVTLVLTRNTRHSFPFLSHSTVCDLELSLALSSDEPSGFTRAKRYLQQAPEAQHQVEHSCIRLQIALQDNDGPGALLLTKEMDQSESLAVHWLLLRSTFAR
jgi:hypothetical protein